MLQEEVRLSVLDDEVEEATSVTGICADMAPVDPDRLQEISDLILKAKAAIDRGMPVFAMYLDVAHYKLAEIVAATDRATPTEPLLTQCSPIDLRRHYFLDVVRKFATLFSWSRKLRRSSSSPLTGSQSTSLRGPSIASTI